MVLTGFPGSGALLVCVCYFHKYSKWRALYTESYEQKLDNDKQLNYSQTEQFVECVCQVRTNLLGLLRRINNRKQDEPIRIELKHTI